jgi:hypothetical protein
MDRRVATGGARGDTGRLVDDNRMTLKISSVREGIWAEDTE